MFNRFYYLQEDGCGDETGRQAALQANMPIMHLVDGRGDSVDRLLLHQYGAEGNYPFCLALRDHGDDRVERLQELVLLLVHPFYEWGEGGKPLFVFGAGCRGQAEEYFAGQRLEVEVLSGETVRLLEAGAGEYYRYCVNEYSPGDVFLLRGAGVEKVIRDLQAVTEDLRLEHPVFSRLAAENADIRKRLARMDRDNGRLVQENSILRELAELSSKHDEVDYILRFYKNEYEILPLWYKRFGHIIKVLQGKRSFRSLYDKKVKKYKD
ncbi:MAG TPA: hypothetical protein VG605_00075 [Puia sp.]|nr:hypothetical protein [Puia sp.]